MPWVGRLSRPNPAANLVSVSGEATIVVLLDTVDLLCLRKPRDEFFSISPASFLLLAIEQWRDIAMLDFYMVLTLAAVYALFRGFLSWCGRVAEGPESDRK